MFINTPGVAGGDEQGDDCEYIFFHNLFLLSLFNNNLAASVDIHTLLRGHALQLPPVKREPL